jgi:transcriptional regulator with XRE-family HTH domain
MHPLMENNRDRTIAEWEVELGEQMRALRLRANLDQITLAKLGGIGLTAIKNLESGKGATLKTLIKVLRTLGRTDWLTSLAPTVSISPLQMLKAKPTRQRASRRRTGDNAGNV